MISQESYVCDAASNLSSKTVDGVTTSFTYVQIDQIYLQIATLAGESKGTRSRTAVWRGKRRPHASRARPPEGQPQNGKEGVDGAEPRADALLAGWF